MSTKEMRKQAIVDIAEYREAIRREKAALAESKVKTAHSSVMNATIAALTMHGIDARTLKGMAVMSRVVHDMITEHVEKNGNNLKDVSPDNDSVA